MPNTREKLIELFFNAEQMVHIPYGMNTKEAERYIFGQMADHLIANGVTVNEWISVKDRLPDKNGEYLCRWINKDVSNADYESTYGSFGYWFNFWEDEYKDWISYDGITHWMPLPQKPKGE